MSSSLPELVNLCVYSTPAAYKLTVSQAWDRGTSGTEQSICYLIWSVCARHDKTNFVRSATSQISLGIRPAWSESSLCAQWVAKDPSFLHADSENSDQTGRMPKLIWVFVGRTFILLVLSCRGSYDDLFIRGTSYCMRHDKTNFVRSANTRISLGIRPVWFESSLCGQLVAKDPSFLHANSEDSDQTGRMPRLI